jgi:hypothetical protein
MLCFAGRQAQPKRLDARLRFEFQREQRLRIRVRAPLFSGSSSSGRGEPVLLACSEVGHADLASLPIDSEMLVMPLS